MMDDGPAAMLRQISRTGIVVLVLGGLLYAFANWLSVIQGAQWGIAIGLALPLALLVMWQLLAGIRTGILPFGRNPISRRDQPWLFWFCLVFEGVMAMLLIWIALWSAKQIV